MGAFVGTGAHTELITCIRTSDACYVLFLSIGLVFLQLTAGPSCPGGPSGPGAPLRPLGPLRPLCPTSPLMPTAPYIVITSS